jgi:hypothetical protein
LTLRSFFALTHERLPFDPSRMLYARLVLPRDRYYVRPDRKPAFFRDVLPRIRALPGVVDATESLMLPPNEGAWTDVAIPGKPHADLWPTDMELCTDGYFRTLGIPLVSGRLLTRDDVESGRYVAVVNRTLAQKYFGEEDPVGRTIKFEVLDRPFVDGPHNTYFEIVGVVANFKTRPERNAYAFHATAYLPASVAGFGEPLHLLVKTTVDPHTLVSGVARAVWAVDPNVVVSPSGSLGDFLDDEFRAPAFEFMTLGAFGGIGLILAAPAIRGPSPQQPRRWRQSARSRASIQRGGRPRSIRSWHCGTNEPPAFLLTAVRTNEDIDSERWAGGRPRQPTDILSAALRPCLSVVL